jgi:hypothetical protein
MLKFVFGILIALALIYVSAIFYLWLLMRRTNRELDDATNRYNADLSRPLISV